PEGAEVRRPSRCPPQNYSSVPFPRSPVSRGCTSCQCAKCRPHPFDRSDDRLSVTRMDTLSTRLCESAFRTRTERPDIRAQHTPPDDPARGQPHWVCRHQPGGRAAASAPVPPHLANYTTTHN